MDESHMSPTVPLDRWKIESDYFDTRRHEVAHQHEKQIANLVIQATTYIRRLKIDTANCDHSFDAI